MADLFGRAGVPALVFSILTLALLGRAKPLEPVVDALEGRAPLLASEPAPGEPVILCAGDSLTAMSSSNYPRLLAQRVGADYRMARVLVAATPGFTSGEFLRAARHARLAERVRPDAVLLLLGTNDVKRSPDWTGARAYRVHMEEIIAMFRRANPEARIVLATPPPITRASLLFTKASARRLAETIVPAVRELAQREKLALVDLYALFSNRPELLGPDGVHPNAAGHSAMAGFFLDALRREGLVREAAPGAPPKHGDAEGEGGG